MKIAPLAFPIGLALVLLPACPTLVCGPGTVEVDGQCVPTVDDDDSFGDDDDTAPDDDDIAPDDDDATDDDDIAPDDDDIAPDDDDTAPVDPGYPEFPEVIDVLTIGVRTGYSEHAGTNTNSLSLCLTETDCFSLNVPDVDDFRVGEMDVYSIEDLGLPRSDVDRVEIRSSNGTDKWISHCLELRFDGEPVYCNYVAEEFGEFGDELASWIDPDGLHNACTTCWDESLTHGPMVGAITPDSARLFLRADATRQVGLHLAEVGEAEAPVVAWTYPSASTDFTAQPLVEGLLPDTEYRYWFEIEGAPEGPQEAFRTPPASGTPTTLSMAFGSCSKFDEQPIFAHIAAGEPDLFFFIGDNHYGNTPDLNALRWYYRWGLERVGRGALATTVSTLATWDDHDYVGNNTDGNDAGKETALRVFSEYWANPAAGTETTPGTFFVHSWGDVDFFFLDDRYYRGFDNSILGAEQTQWLQDELAASTATFKLLLSGSQWTTHGSSDSWATFPEATDALYEFIRDQAIDGVVLLSGDVHRSEFRLNPGADGGYDFPELVSSPLANSNSSCGDDGELLECFNSSSYYITVDIDTTAPDPSLTATLWDESGSSLTDWTILRSSLE
ncbi:MAG: hypothetical protein GY898_04190 [Proteobacteria bacterium]|nr:hypothetical protein [Pseudomonadota bacterium]